jgi:polysaccharide export outer membrane protein
MVKLCGLFLFSVALPMMAAGKTEQPPKELVMYIQGAKKLGLTEEQVRANATAAGWDVKIIDEALAASKRPLDLEPSRQADGDLPDGYRIGIGDVLQIAVWREPEASVPSASVRSDGKISIPLIKEVEVVGLSPAEAEKMLAERLARYIHGADVAVIVKEVHSRKIYLVGGVKAVGTVDLKGPMTVLQAITQSGGLTEYAKRKQIYVLRVDNGKQVKLPFNYEAVIKGENMEQNIVLFANDTIVVPQ